MVSSRQRVYRLLAVDDNDLNLGLFRLFLSQLGHDVTAVNNPFDAIKLASESTFDLIFTDVQMPGMTGIEAAQHFRDNGFTGPIIAITAHLSTAEEEAILEAPVNGLLIKPVTKPDLIRTLRRCFSAAGEPISEVRLEPAEYSVASSAMQRFSQDRSAAIYDNDLALRRANGSPALANDLAGALQESLSEAALDLGKHIEQSQLEAIAQTLHKLTGGVRLTGAARLESELEICRQDLEQNQFDGTCLLSLIQELDAWLRANPKPLPE